MDDFPDWLFVVTAALPIVLPFFGLFDAERVKQFYKAGFFLSFAALVAMAVGIYAFSQDPQGWHQFKIMLLGLMYVACMIVGGLMTLLLVRLAKGDARARQKRDWR